MKNEKGAISIFTTLACLFFLIFIMVAYRNVSAKARSQVETTEVLVDSYKSDTDSGDIYNTLVTDESVSGKTVDENSTINSGTSNYIAIDGKIYNIAE